MKKTFLALALVIALICAITVPSFAEFVGSTTLTPAIEAEAAVQDENGEEVPVDVFDPENRDVFEKATTPAIMVTAAAEVDEEATPAFAKVVDAVAEAESIEEVVEALELNAEELGITSDYAVVDFAYVEANEALTKSMGDKTLTVTVALEGVTEKSEVIVIFIPDDPAAERQTVESTVNENGTVSFEFMESGTYMFLVKM